jgi:hypothetical protein
VNYCLLRCMSPEVAHLCRLARCTKVVSYFSYYRRAGRTGAIAVVDPRRTEMTELGWARLSPAVFR